MRDVLCSKRLQLLDGVVGCIDKEATNKGDALVVREVTKRGVYKGGWVKELNHGY